VRLLKRDEAAGEVDEGEVVGGLSLVTNEQRAVAIVPAVGALDDPAARLAASAADQRRFAPSSYVRSHSAIANLLLGVGVVVALVETQVLRHQRPSPPPKHDRVERSAGHPLVVDVGSGHLDGDRDASAVSQDVAFCAKFCTIGRTGTRMVPPFGAFTVALSSEHHVRSTPT
jgi:hypothetical protein